MIDRNRIGYFMAIILTIALGLASRRFQADLPAFLGKYPGDALWALMVFFAWGFILPRASTLSIALLAIGTSCGVEVLKFCREPWLLHLRHTTFGHLVLGHAFSWQNLIAYAVGAVIGVGAESMALKCNRV